MQNCAGMISVLIRPEEPSKLLEIRWLNQPEKSSRLVILKYRVKFTGKAENIPIKMELGTALILC